MSGCVNAPSSDGEAFSPMLEQKEEIAQTKEPDIITCRVYKIRWAILFMTILYVSSSLMQWIQYAIIADVLVKYYNISYTAADWSAMIYLIVYAVFSIPGSYLLDTVNLRIIVLVAMTGTCVGAWIKLGSVDPDRYWVLLLGQGIVAVFQVLVFPILPKIAGIWFGPKEFSLACSIGVLGSQVGIAMGYLLPPMFVNNLDSQEDIERGLHRIALGTAIICTFILLVLFFFKAAPATPPSVAQIKLQEHQRTSFSYMQTLKRLFFNRSYLLLMISYTINVGVFFAVGTLLGQIVLKHYPDALQDAGRIGFLSTISCMVGSLACGTVLGKLRRYKETTLVVYGGTIVLMVSFTFTLDLGIEVLYLNSMLLMFFLMGVFTIGLELAAELTYPEPEGTSAGLLVAGSQITGISCISLYSYMFYNIGSVWANLTMSALLLGGFVLMTCIRFDLRRQAAGEINK